MGLLETTDNVVKRGSYPEVLLLQTELLAALQVVVGVQDSTDSLSSLLVSDRALVVSVVELLEVELSARGLTGPESEVVGRRRVVARNRHIESHSLDDFASLPLSDGLALVIDRLGNISKELNLERRVSSCSIAIMCMGWCLHRPSHRV